MMMRVKLVIINSSDGSTVSRLISTRICNDSDSGRPSPPSSFTARARPSAVCAWAAGAAVSSTRPPAMAAARSQVRPRSVDMEIALAVVGQPGYAAARHRDQYLLPRELDDRKLRSGAERSEEHTSELQSLMRISYAVFCLKKKKT